MGMIGNDNIFNNVAECIMVEKRVVSSHIVTSTRPLYMTI